MGCCEVTFTPSPAEPGRREGCSLWPYDLRKSAPKPGTDVTGRRWPGRPSGHRCVAGTGQSAPHLAALRPVPGTTFTKNFCLAHPTPGRLW